MKVKVSNTSEEEEINWSKPNQLLTTFDGTVIVLNNGEHLDTIFTGITIKSSVRGFGDKYSNWRKENFKLFQGKIILSN